MTKEKKIIEEMANIYYEAMLKARATIGSMNEGAPKWYAKAFYNTDYRKQSEGEWGFDGMSWTCSECNEYATKGIRTSFCPNCGARMKGGEKNA